MTFEDLLDVGDGDKARAEFITKAVSQFKGSEDYRNALIADRYYHKHNVTIETFVKWLYTVTGRKVKDEYSADYRLQTQHFRRAVIQHANYLLGKGVQLSKPELKDKLGKKFDHNVLRLAKIAMVEGRSFGFWNVDHLEVFGYACTDKHAGFCPLYSGDTGELMAGIRFWYRTVDNRVIESYTLYEADGYTDFGKGIKDNEVVIKSNKQSYKTKVNSTPAEGIIGYEPDGYNGVLPIVPMYASDTFESDLIGHREAIDCYDLIKSGLANTIDDASEIYWIVKNAGGMNDPDLARFLQRIKRTKAAQVNSEDGEDATPHTIDVPYEAREKLLEILRTDLYDDMMLVDRRSLSAAQKTEQELDMAYQGIDDYTNDLESFVYDFLDNIFALAGLDVEATMIRNKVANKTERTSMVLSAANYISPECVVSHLDFLTPEEQEEEISKLQTQQIEQFNANEDDEEGEDE